VLHDVATPPGVLPPSAAANALAGIAFSSARWTPSDLGRLMNHLAELGSRALEEIPQDDLLKAWCEAVDEFRDPSSAERRSLDPALSRLCRLSAGSLEAALEVVLGGVAATAIRPLVELAPEIPGDPSPLLVILSSNLPGLAVQPLLPALLLRRPILLKSASAEPLFAPAFVRALSRRQPALGEGVAAVTWMGGDQALEAPVLDRAGRILAYGDCDSIESIERRASGKVYAYGPKTSLAIIGRGVPVERIAEGLARDIALFDQRGCLSVQAVYVEGDARMLAEALAIELVGAAQRLPPSAPDPVVAAGVQQIRLEAALRGLWVAELSMAVGTVVVDPSPEFRLSPGLRTVRIHPIEELSILPEVLAPWSGRLQGAALAGQGAWSLQLRLESLGISRCAEPGQLQAADATWHNGGIHPFEALTGRAP
jgi:hypothetical protein